MKPSRRLLGLLSTTVLCLAPALAAAQDDKASQKNKRGANEAKAEAITVTGRGSTRQVQGLSQTQLSQAYVSGTSVLKALGTLPGVSYESADPLGIDPWAQSFYIRGFSSAQLGFTLDDIPLGNPGYGSIGGVNLTNAISQQNVEQINVSQSAGPVDVASSDNLGGVVQAYSLDPSDKYGGVLSQTFGSNSSYVTFIRLDSGILNPSGTKLFVSYNRANEDKWKGSGSMNLDQVNFKLQQPIGQESEADVFFDWSSARDDTYDDLSNEIISKLGTRVDYLEPNFAAAYGVANYEQGRPGASLPPGYAQLSDPVDASYYNGPAVEEDYIGGMKFDLHLAPGLRWKTTFYGIGKSFGAYWPNPYLDSPDGAPIAVQNRGDNAQRFGATSDLLYRIARQDLDVGIWYEYGQDEAFKEFSQETVLGEGSPINPIDSTPAPFATAYRLYYTNNTIQPHLQDTFHPGYGFTINAGLRSLLFSGRSDVLANDKFYTGVSTIPSGTIDVDEAFLPQFSVNYRISRRNEVFFDFSKNARTFDETGFGQASPWGATNQATFNAEKSGLAPETAFVYELGYRYTAPSVKLLLTAYHVDFHNRLGTIEEGPIVDTTSVLANLGSVEQNGIDTSLTVVPLPHFLPGLSIINNLSFNSSKYQQNLDEEGVVYATEGKQEVNYPEFIWNAAASYNYKDWNSQFNVTYMGHRYLSFNNDESEPGYWLTNFSIDRKIPLKGFVQSLDVSFNVYNVLNAKYISVTGENGNPLSGDLQSLLIGAPRQFFGGIKAEF